MSIPLQRLKTASKDNLIAYMSALGRHVPGFECTRDGRLIRISADMPYPMFNRILETPTDLTAAALTSLIQRVQARYARRGSPMMWIDWDGEENPELAERLLGTGFALSGRIPGMGLALAEFKEEMPAIPGLAISSLTKAEEFEVYKAVSAQTFGLPLPLNALLVDAIAGEALRGDGRTVSYLAELDGVPVAIATSFNQGEVAGIYNVGTLPSVRGKGIGRAVTVHAVREARDAGASLAVLQASKMGEPVYRRIGFQDGLMIGLYQWEPPAAAF
ncbi:GNAT family N-acetyltransferase [Cohnella nanjingensis]|uniref:GNAT family N-acetyltransferase n=1 Tax=Cohnella nanjingensis TaxID=1387779 RepID=A0A7X0RU95_9BACL|nr:GNAT family N-acetyltransferase [Cohnella nanjingensis]MBB6673641.1 GNAT family N-acetyltransferase [Cohnella nanjingensis]